MEATKQESIPMRTQAVAVPNEPYAPGSQLLHHIFDVNLWRVWFWPSLETLTRSFDTSTRGATKYGLGDMADTPNATVVKSAQSAVSSADDQSVVVSSNTSQWKTSVQNIAQKHKPYQVEALPAKQAVVVKSPAWTCEIKCTKKLNR